jgi:hypothetical protein
MEFFEEKAQKEKAFVFWLFNPFTIIIIYAFSNIDIFPVILTVISFLMIKRQKLLPAAVLMGIAAGFKLYPLLFIPFLFLSGRNLKEKIMLSFTPLVVFGVIILPFISQAFIQSALVSGLTTGIFASSLTVLSISALFFYAAFIDKWDTATKRINLFKYWTALFLIIFSLTLFHIQWLLWVIPFLIIYCVKNLKLSILIFILGIISFTVPALFQDRSMTISLFRVYSTWFDALPTPFTLIQKFYDPGVLQIVFQSMLAGGSLITIYKIFKEA